MSKPYHKEEERRQLMKPNKNIQLKSQATNIWLSNSTSSSERMKFFTFSNFVPLGCHCTYFNGLEIDINNNIIIIIIMTKYMKYWSPS
jgi:hypothetical protein